MCWHRFDRLVHLSHELGKPIGGDEHVVDLRVVNPLDRPGLDALQDLANRRERVEGTLYIGRRGLLARFVIVLDAANYTGEACICKIAVLPPRKPHLSSLHNNDEFPACDRTCPRKFCKAPTRRSR